LVVGSRKTYTSSPHPLTSHAGQIVGYEMPRLERRGLGSGKHTASGEAINIYPGNIDYLF